MRSRQRVIHCLTGEILLARGYRPTVEPQLLELARGRAVPLRGGLLPVSLRMSERYEILERRGVRSGERWVVIIAGYFYALEVPETEAELLAFHWHPHVPGKTFPHLHLRAGLGLRADVSHLHIPTGLLSLEDAVQFAIDELQVRPGRRDWAAILEAGREVL